MMDGDGIFSASFQLWREAFSRIALGSQGSIRTGELCGLQEPAALEMGPAQAEMDHTQKIRVWFRRVRINNELRRYN